MGARHRLGWRWLVVLVLIASFFAAVPAQAATLQVTVTLIEMTGHLVIAPPGGTTRAGAPITYGFLLRNAITVTQSFRLSVSGPPGWRVNLGNGKSDKQGPLAPGESVVIPVVVTPPKKAAVGATGVVTLSALTTDRPQFQDQDSVITTVVGSGVGAGLEASGTAPELAARPAAGARYSPVAGALPRRRQFLSWSAGAAARTRSRPAARYRDRTLLERLTADLDTLLAEAGAWRTPSGAGVEEEGGSAGPQGQPPPSP